MNKKYVPIKATETYQQLMMEYYVEAKMAEGTDRKIAWITSGAPVEILNAADVIPIYPENHAALCSARHESNELAQVAEERGFSRDLCGYARTDFGSLYTGNSPIGGSPKPDFLLCCNNICGTVTKWYQELQRELNVPLLYLDTPFVHDEEPTDAAIAYVRAQLEDIITAVGDMVGKPIEMDTLVEMLISGREASNLWGDILDLLAAKPAPISSFDTFIHMAPIVVMRGLKKCLDYYELLRDEVKQRVADGIAAVPGERFRLGWYNLRDMAKKFAKRQACLVAATYTYGWAPQVMADDYDDPMDAMAEGYMASYINSGFHLRKEVLSSMVEKYDLDGVVMHSNRSCRAYSIGMYDLARFLEEECNAPVLMIEADHCDPRSFAEEQTFTRIDAFIETLESRKAVA
jgi:benzoyl-CoA reductase/2-hydroxyglutaryl-CoA dehydratase subunit BcrC/BadD/HgdB